MSDFEITEPLVRKLLETVDAGLVKGLGEPEPGKMCVEAAISYALGEDHSDRPSCVAPAVRAGKIVLNDADWYSDESRARGMRHVAIAQLGSAGVVDEVQYAKRLAELTIQKLVPLALRHAAEANPEQAEALHGAARRCEREGSEAAARAAEAAARAARAAEAAVAATEAAVAAAWAAARAATRGVAGAAAGAARATEAAARDQVLELSASLMVRALQECGSPGCDWLWLVDKTGASDDD